MLTCGEGGEQPTACGSAMYRKREKHDGENDAWKAHSIRATGRACDSARRSAPYGVRPAAQAGKWSSKRPSTRHFFLQIDPSRKNADSLPRDFYRDLGETRGHRARSQCAPGPGAVRFRPLGTQSFQPVS